MTRRLLIILACAAIAAPVSAQTPPSPNPTGPEVEAPAPERPRRRRPRQGTEPRPADRPAPTAPAPAPAPTGAPATAAPPAGLPVIPAAPATATPAATTPPTSTAPTAPGAVATGDLPGEDSELYRCKKFKPTDKIKVTLKPDTDLKDLVAWVMGFTCKSFIFGNAISSRASKVTIIAPAEMTPQEAYRLFLVGLQTMNLTIVPKGRTLELVETQRGREMPLPVYRSGKAVPGQDQVVRAIIRPEHVTAEELVTVLNAVKTGTGTVTPLGTAGAVLVTDYGSSIDKMMDILKEVDAPTGGEKIYIIYLQNADAQDIAQKLGDIFGTGRTGAAGAPAAPAPQIPAAGQAPNAPRPATAPATRGGTGGSAAPSKIIADTRTNSLIVIASERAYQRIVALVRRLDVGGPSETGSINVYYLKNADAEQLAGTMNTLITGVAPQRPGQPGQPGQPARPVNVPAAVTQQGGAAGSLAGAFEGTIKLTHDKPTNSLVVVSSPRDFFALREVIKKLDLPRGQVFVEATILEVSLDKARKIGFAYHGGKQFSTSDGDVTVIGGVESATLQSLDPLGSAVNLDGLIGGVIGPLIPGLSIPSIGVLFQIAQNNTEVNVLSAPNILTTDNEPAEIKVGQNIPYQAATFAGLPGLTQQQGQQGGITGFGGLGANIQRQDVDLSLKITPHVSDEHVRLEVELDIKDIQGEIPGLGPTWSTRRVKTPIVVRDQQPVVIGGLMSERETVAETKVPVLGDIPLLGYLFKYTRRQRVKTNLLIFLTPYVIKDQSDVQRIFAQKVRERREFIEAYSSLAARDIEPYVDYRRKRGLVEEINKSVFTADEDERLLREAMQNKGKFTGEEGPVEMPPELRDAPPPDTTTPQPQPQPQPPPPPPGDE